MKPICYYITAHGYGHGARSCDVLRMLNQNALDQPVIVITDLSKDFLNSRLQGCKNLTFRRGAFDIGLVQNDSVRSDIPRTLEELKKLYRCEKAVIAGEQQFLEKNRAGLVVADIPAIPLKAAQQSGIPNLAIGNFSWDWIYEPYAEHDPEWNLIIEKFRDAYSKTDLLLRLPFAPSMESFPRQKDIPLLAAPGTPCREKILNSNSLLQRDKPWILLSFTSLNLTSAALENIHALSTDYEFFCVEPLCFPGSCIHEINPQIIPFSDILASCDLVISKPGFGLVSECIANGKPLIYSDRGNFAEYPYLVEGIENYLKNVYLPSDELYAGHLKTALDKIKTAPPPSKKLKSGGAEIIASELLRLISDSDSSGRRCGK